MFTSVKWNEKKLFGKYENYITRTKFEQKMYELSVNIFNYVASLTKSSSTLIFCQHFLSLGATT